MFQVTVRTAEHRDISKIMELKSDAYGVRGYCSQTGTYEQYLNNQFALMAEIDDEIVGTMSIMYDQGRIPTDEVFPDETAQVRSRANRVAYYGTFAVKPGMWRHGTRSVGLALIHEAIRLAKADQVDAAIIIVHPRHIPFYQRFGFKVVAKRDNMPGLEKAPAVMMVLMDGSCLERLARRAA